MTTIAAASKRAGAGGANYRSLGRRNERELLPAVGFADAALFTPKLLLDVVVDGLGEVMLSTNDGVPLFQYVELDKT